MAKFADQEIEDLIINIHIYNRKNSLKILEFAKNLQNPKFKRIILHESQQDNPYFLIEPNDPAWEIMNLQQLRHWLQENIIHQAIIIGTSSLVDWFTGIGLQIANHSYIGMHILFTPTAMYCYQCPLEISNYLSLLFTARTMLEYLQEKDKVAYSTSAIMKPSNNHSTHKKTRNTSIYPRETLKNNIQNTIIINFRKKMANLAEYQKSS